MKTITLGEKFDYKYGFRETCFGIVSNKDKMLVVIKNGQASLVGGGIEAGESHQDCLKREFLEESGYQIKNIEEFVCIDCFWLAAGKYPLESKANIYIVEVDKKNICNPTEADCNPIWIESSEALNLLPLPYHKKAVELFMAKQNRNSFSTEKSIGAEND